MLNQRLTIIKTENFDKTKDPVFNKGFAATKRHLKKLPSNSVSFDLSDHDSIMYYLELYLPNDYLGEFNFKDIDCLIQLLNTGEIADDGDYDLLFEKILIQREFNKTTISLINTEAITSREELKKEIADLTRKEWNIGYDFEENNEDEEEYYEIRGCREICEDILAYFE